MMNPSQPIYGGEVLTHNPGKNSITFYSFRIIFLGKGGTKNDVAEIDLTEEKSFDQYKSTSTLIVKQRQPIEMI